MEPLIIMDGEYTMSGYAGGVGVGPYNHKGRHLTSLHSNLKGICHPYSSVTVSVFFSCHTIIVRVVFLQAVSGYEGN